GVERGAWQERLATGRRRIDIGTSLGYRGSDPEGFFAHAAQTQQLFARLFPGPPGPGGRPYGPATIRAHYGGYTSPPHFDSVRLREKREGYAVHRFAHQFA